MVNRAITERVYKVTALIALSSVVFYLFFQINKNGPFRLINPFAEDPFDAVGSFAVQGALLISLLTYARSLRLRDDPTQSVKMRLIQRGNLLVLLAILVTLFADVIVVTYHPISLSEWGIILLVELALMFLLTTVCALMLIAVFRHTPMEIPSKNLTPADAIDDLLTLARVPVMILRPALPGALVAWVNGFNSDLLFARVPWFNPRMHPWRFACILGLIVGAGLFVAQLLLEGPPPNWLAGLLVAGIFISAEFFAALAGFAIFGGYLGLRPSIRR
jgi:hypothetical protein